MRLLLYTQHGDEHGLTEVVSAEPRPALVARPARARPPRRPDGPAGVACVTGACPGASPLIGCATLPGRGISTSETSEMRGYPTIVKVTTFVLDL